MTSGLSNDDGRFPLLFFKSFYLIEELKNAYCALWSFFFLLTDTNFSVKIKESEPNKTQIYAKIQINFNFFHALAWHSVNNSKIFLLLFQIKKLMNHIKN